MVGQTMNDLKSRIINQMVSSCSCMTKTPIPEYHEENCLYKVLGDCLSLIDNPSYMVYHILGDELTERFIKDQHNIINDLADPWQESDYSCRVGLQPVKFAVEILEKLYEPLHDDFMELHNDIKNAIDELPNNCDIDDILKVSNTIKENWKPSKLKE
jgi:hypothetical protein